MPNMSAVKHTVNRCKGRKSAYPSQGCARAYRLWRAAGGHLSHKQLGVRNSLPYIPLHTSVPDLETCTRLQPIGSQVSREFASFRKVTICSASVQKSRKKACKVFNKTSKMSMDETMIQGAEECSQAINGTNERSYELSAVMTFTGRAVR